MFLLSKNKQFLAIISSFLIIIFSFFFIILKLINNSIKYKDDKIIYEKYEIFKDELSKNTNNILRIKQEKISETFNYISYLYFNNKNCYKYFINSKAKNKLNIYFKHRAINPFHDKNDNIAVCTETTNYIKYFEKVFNTLNIIYFKSKIKDTSKLKHFNEISFSNEPGSVKYLSKKFLYNFEYQKYKIIERKNSLISIYFKNKTFDNSFYLNEEFNTSIENCQLEYLDNYYLCKTVQEYIELLNFKNYVDRYSFEKFINNKNYLNEFKFNFYNNKLDRNGILFKVSSFQNLKEFDKYRQKEKFHSNYNYLFFEISKNNYLSITYMIYLLILTAILYLILNLIYKLKI